MAGRRKDDRILKSDLIDDGKSVDKLEIENEEKAKMKEEDSSPVEENNKEKMPANNGNESKQTRITGGEIEKKKKALEEAALTGGATHRPIGGIKIPGFLKSVRSKDKTKEGDEGEEKADLLVETPASEKVNSPTTSPNDKEKGESSSNLFPILNNFKFNVPFLTKKRSAEEQPEIKLDSTQLPPEATDDASSVMRPRLINAIKLPLASLVPRKLKSKDEEFENSLNGIQAGLASMETLDDSNGDFNKKFGREEYMENIALDPEMDPERAEYEDEADSKWANKDWQKWLALAKEHKFAVCGISVFLILLIILIITVLIGPGVPKHAPIINGKYIEAVTSCGYVEGVLEGAEFVFKGVPYAKPPTGELRYLPPQPMTLDDCWNGTLKTHNATPSCWQIFPNNSMDGSEDCLTLDIYTPYVRYDTPLPVLFLVGADSLNGGWPSKLIIPSGLSKMKEFVIVRPRFRLTVLGFLSALPLSQSVYPRSSGNYGLADVIAALDWTRLNIQHFSGNPRSVTVMGYKAGATLATLLTTIRRPEKLFARLWLSSGTSVFPNISLVESENFTFSYLQSLGCASGDDRSNANCLRKADVEDLLDNIPDSWKPSREPNLPSGTAPGHQWLVNDGHYLRQHPQLTWASRNLSVQVMIGTTLHSEISPEWYLQKKSWTAKQIRDVVEKSQIGIEGLTDKVLSVYNATTVGLAAIISDITTVCPLYAMHKMIPSSKFYLVTQPSDAATNNGLVYDGADVQVALGTYPYQTSPPQRRYIAAMRNLFYSFTLNGVGPFHRVTIVNQDITSDRKAIHEINVRCSMWKEMGFDKFAKID